MDTIQQSCIHLLNMRNNNRLDTTSQTYYGLQSYIRQYNQRVNNDITQPSCAQTIDYIYNIYNKLICNPYVELLKQYVKDTYNQHHIHNNTYDSTTISATTLYYTLPLQQQCIDEIYELCITMLHLLLKLDIQYIHYISYYIIDIFNPYITIDKMCIQNQFDSSIYQCIMLIQQWHNRYSSSISVYGKYSIAELYQPYSSTSGVNSNNDNISNNVVSLIQKGFYNEIVSSALLRYRHTQRDQYVKQMLHYNDAYLQLQSQSLNYRTNDVYYYHNNNDKLTNQLSCNDYVFNNYTERYVQLEQAQQQLQQQLINTSSGNYNPQSTVDQIYQRILNNAARNNSVTQAYLSQPTTQQYVTLATHVTSPNVSSYTMSAVTGGNVPSSSTTQHTTAVSPSMQHPRVTTPYTSTDTCSDTGSVYAPLSGHHTNKPTTSTYRDVSKSKRSGSCSASQHSRKRGKTLPDSAVKYMQNWLFEHYQHPYPTYVH